MGFVPWNDVTMRILDGPEDYPRQLSTYYYYLWESLDMIRNEEDSIVCKTGITTGTTQGYYMFKISETPSRWRWAVALMISGYYGDSGGPIYTIRDSGHPFHYDVAYLVGMFVGRDCWKYGSEEVCFMIGISADKISDETGVTPWTLYGGP